MRTALATNSWVPTPFFVVPAKTCFRASVGLRGLKAGMFGTCGGVKPRVVGLCSADSLTSDSAVGHGHHPPRLSHGHQQVGLADPAGDHVHRLEPHDISMFLGAHLGV